MTAIAKAIWTNPTVCAAALQVANTTLLAQGTVPAYIAVPLSVIAAVANVAAVKMGRRR